MTTPDDAIGLPTRKTLTDAVEEHLRNAILSGRWADRLPGLRTIAAELDVGSSTVAAAAARLRKAGILENTGPKSRLRISRESLRKEAGRREGRFLFLTHTPLSATSPAVSMILRELVRRRPNWLVRHRTHSFHARTRIPRGWDRILEEEMPDFMVLVSGTPKTADWAQSRGVPTILLGGEPGASPLPVLGVETGVMLDQALDHLSSQGHWRIMMPLCHRSEAMCQTVRRVFGRHLTAAGKPLAEGYNTPHSDQRDPRTLMDILERVWRAQPPTAIVLFDWNEFVTISCFLKMRRLTIPTDISVVVLEDHPSHEWHVPVICHFRYPVEAVTRELIRWSRSWRRLSSSKVAVSPVWFPGESTGPPCRQD